MPLNSYSITDQSGLYNKYVPPGNYTISLPEFNPPNFTGICTPLNNFANVSALNIHDAGNNFGAFSGIQDHELEISLTQSTPFLSVDTSIIQLTAKNNFFFTDSVKVTMKYESGLTYIGSVPQADSSTASTLTWLLPPITPYHSVGIDVSFVDTVFFSPDSVRFSAIIEPLAGDWNTTNNYDTLVTEVVSSWDPNAKEVHPVGDIPVNIVQDGQYLNYIVRFQNTGIASAYRVIIIDTLSPNLDLSTLEIVDYSHSPCNITIVDDRMLVFWFHNINLPSENVSSSGSHGFVQYRIKMLTSLAPGDFIENTAAIIFDFNEAIITNNVITNIIWPLEIAELEYVSKSKRFAYLNNGWLNLIPGKFNQTEQIEISIFDLMGKPVFESRLNPSKLDAIFDFTNHSAGIYLIKLNSESEEMNQKLLYIKD